MNIWTFELKGHSADTENFFQDWNHAGKRLSWRWSNRDHLTLQNKSSVKGYHAHKDIWTSAMSEKFVTLMEPDNEVVKYAACVKKKNVVISHIPLGKN